MAKTLKVGLIGLGDIALAHVPGWQASPHTELVAGSYLRPARREIWQQAQTGMKFYDHPADLIADSDLDIIDICSPNMFHTEQVVAALEAGKHVICEKPLAPTPAEIRKMIAARDRSGKLLMTAQHMRYRGASRALKAEIDKGALGEVYHARAWWLRRSDLPPRPTFIYKDRAGGGACIDIGVHVLDMALWLMGYPQPVTVSGTARIGLAHHAGAFTTYEAGLVPPDVDVEDFAAGLVRFENGATLVLEVSWLLHHQPREDVKVWLYGAEGGCQWPSAQLHFSDYEAQQLVDTQLVWTEDPLGPHALECMDFAQAIVEGRPSPVPPEQSLVVQVILDGIYRSQVQGREVRLS